MERHRTVIRVGDHPRRTASCTERGQSDTGTPISTENASRTRFHHRAPTEVRKPASQNDRHELVTEIRFDPLIHSTPARQLFVRQFVSDLQILQARPSPFSFVPDLRRMLDLDPTAISVSLCRWRDQDLQGYWFEWPNPVYR